MSSFAEDLHAALAGPDHSISPKYFYDAQGSSLFERICELPEYYPTRTELALLDQHAPEFAARMGQSAQLIEYGAGALVKVRRLLAHAPQLHSFAPVDISGPHLLAACESLWREYPHLRITPVIADFTRAHRLPEAPEGGRRIGFFPGSSIGNFDPQEALTFLKLLRTELDGGALLIGVDLIKDPALLHAAYNDAQGVTARFNLNLLRHAQRELGLEYDAQGFDHYAFYEPRRQRIEMHLLPRGPQMLQLQGRRYPLVPGQSLHTESSYKYSVETFQQLAREAGFVPQTVWTDDAKWFSLHWLAA
ncbi:L-histidine N(alpha)-methyltransferase [Roseateles amylovorans]|uniref:L-histidine N(Alpha)-methyltransferase n=1 Tax=Roseateles amylovorans TaxID=2978473 RepID=A0ABY6B7S7_9BURK|nr:L-histidine N(alpha)-methyltransferase [Roseateles amylovorans]UXH79610.1 L-histidine N(alpha)-methyltransferase [Roseateles amylovorans]